MTRQEPTVDLAVSILYRMPPAATRTSFATCGWTCALCDWLDGVCMCPPGGGGQDSPFSQLDAQRASNLPGRLGADMRPNARKAERCAAPPPEVVSRESPCRENVRHVATPFLGLDCAQGGASEVGRPDDRYAAHQPLHPGHPPLAGHAETSTRKFVDNKSTYAPKCPPSHARPSFPGSRFRDTIDIGRFSDFVRVRFRTATHLPNTQLPNVPHCLVGSVRDNMIAIIL